jgi:hypothetical protein
MFESEFIQIQAQIRLAQEQHLGLDATFAGPPTTISETMLVIVGHFFFTQFIGTSCLQVNQVILYETCGFDLVLFLVFAGLWGIIVCMVIATLSP